MNEFEKWYGREVEYQGFSGSYESARRAWCAALDEAARMTRKHKMRFIADADCDALERDILALKD
jgi:hypothetical protein